MQGVDFNFCKRENKESDRSWNNHLAPMKNFLECDSNSRLQLKQPFRIFDSSGWDLIL